MGSLSVELTPADWIQLIIAATAGIAAVVAIWQTNLTRKQMQINLRPWIGSHSEGLNGDGKGLFIFNFQNYGNSPATKVRGKIGLTYSNFTREELRERPFDDHAGSIMLPNEKKHKSIRADSNQFQELKAMSKSAFIGVIIEYEYTSNKVAEYGAILEFELATGEVDFLDEWTENLN